MCLQFVHFPLDNVEILHRFKKKLKNLTENLFFFLKTDYMLQTECFSRAQIKNVKHQRPKWRIAIVHKKNI